MRAAGLARELCWLAPFACLALLLLVPLRPWRTPPASAQDRSVVDALGRMVLLPAQVRVVAMLGEYLPQTDAPARLFRAGRPRDQEGFARSLGGRLWPQVAQDGRLWKGPGTQEVEMAWPGDVAVLGRDNPLRRRLGLLAVATLTWPLGRDDTMFRSIRISNAVIGEPAVEAEARIARYRAAFAGLERDMRPDEVADRPRMLGLGAPSNDWSRIVISDDEDDSDGSRRLTGASEAVGRRRALGRQQDAERVLALDPDVLMIWGVAPQDFMRDPRWRGLKAVTARRVYARNPAFCGYIYDLDNLPYSTRWIAEILHPERLQPKVRELLRAHYLEAYGYRLSDGEIDELLNVELNRGSAGYARFMASSSGEAKE